MGKSDFIIEVNHVSKQFEDGKYALNDVSLQVKKGEFVTILGPSGCGKTTLLRCIAGFQVASSGDILLKGEDVTKTPPYKRPVNTVFQKYLRSEAEERGSGDYQEESASGAEDG